jgi:hypothetical protein
MSLLPEDPALIALPGVGKPPGVTGGGGHVPNRVTRRIYSEQTDGEILPVHGYRDGRVNRYRSFSGLVLFSLVVPLLQPGVVEPYLVCGTWFPNRLSLEGTNRILIFGP